MSGNILILLATLLACASRTTAVTTQQLSATVGGETNITCLFGEGTLRNIYWYFNTTQRILTLAKGVLTVAPPYKGRATLQNDNNTLSLKGITIADEGTYRCDVDRQGQPAVLHIYSDLNIYSLRPSTLPVVSPCAMIGESAHCTAQANDTFSLTCTLFNVYPVKEAILTWYQDGKSVSSTYGATLEDNAITNLSLPIQVTQSKNLSCNATFESADGRQHTAVSVEAWILVPSGMTDESDPKNETLNGRKIAGIAVASFISIVAIGVMIIKFRRRKQNKDAGTVEVSQLKSEAKSELATEGEHDDEVEEGNVHKSDSNIETGTSQCLPESVPLINEPANNSTDDRQVSKVIMKDILTANFLLELSKGIDPQTVSPKEMSIYLGFSGAEGVCEAISGNILQRQRDAYQSLFTKYVTEHGRKEDSALDLMKVFLQYKMKLYADLVREELTQCNIQVPSDEEIWNPDIPRDNPASPQPRAAVDSTSISPSTGTTDAGSASTTGHVRVNHPSKKHAGQVQTQLSTMTETLTEKKLIKVAEAVAVDKNLLILGLKLGFKEPKVKMYISANKRNDSSEGTSSMLFDWKRKTPRAKQIPDLIKALNESGFGELVDDFFPSGHV